MSNCYKHPYLNKVIARIDFTARIQLPQKGLTKKLSDEILKLFSIPEPREVLTKKVQLSLEGTTESHEKQNHLFFHSSTREKLLCISPDFLYIEINRYSTYDILKQEFNIILDKLFEAEEFSANRFGLRFINNIDIAEDNPLQWENYINQALLYMFDATKNKSFLSRAFTNIVQQFDDGMLLNFNYGMHNPDFPTRIKRKLFILDYDASYQGVLSKDEIKSKIDIAHERIEQLFENSITDSLRTKMDLTHE